MTSVASASAAASRLARRASSTRPAAASARPKTRASAGAHAAVRQRTQPRAAHQRVGVALVHLIQHRGAAGDERRAGHRLRHAPAVRARRSRRGSSRPRWWPRRGGSAAAWSARRSRRDRATSAGHAAAAPARRRARRAFFTRGLRVGSRPRARPAIVVRRSRPTSRRVRSRHAAPSRRELHAPASQRQHQRRRQHQRAADHVHAVDPDVAPGEHGQRAERHLHRDAAPRSAPPAASARGAVAVVIPDVRRSREHRQRHDQRADAVREVDRDLRIPVVGTSARTSTGSREWPGRRRSPAGGVPLRRRLQLLALVPVTLVALGALGYHLIEGLVVLRRPLHGGDDADHDWVRGGPPAQHRRPRVHDGPRPRRHLHDLLHDRGISARRDQRRAGRAPRETSHGKENR